MVGLIRAKSADAAVDSVPHLPIYDHLISLPHALAVQAATGNVPRSLPPGHEDGWGIGSFDDADRVSLIRQTGSAQESAFFTFAAKAAEDGGAGSTPARLCIGHLRKATRGVLSSENSHPIRMDFPSSVGKGYETLLVAHNGTVYEPLLIGLRADLAENERDEARADSDSVVLAAWIVQRLQSQSESDLHSALAVTLGELLDRDRKIESGEPGYSGLNLLMAHSTGLYALRRFRKLPDYYTLYRKPLPNDGGWIVASEPTDGNPTDWEPLIPGVLYHFTDGQKPRALSVENPLQ